MKDIGCRLHLQPELQASGEAHHANATSVRLDHSSASLWHDNCYRVGRSRRSDPPPPGPKEPGITHAQAPPPSRSLPVIATAMHIGPVINAVTDAAKRIAITTGDDAT